MPHDSVAAAAAWQVFSSRAGNMRFSIPALERLARGARHHWEMRSMAEARFKVGDVVQLPSGGPTMTVAGIESAGNHPDAAERVECRWFEHNEYGYWTLRIESFPADALVKADAS
jgi:uncharacterized protein YodC (DUF2158 family)